MILAWLRTLAQRLVEGVTGRPYPLRSEGKSRYNKGNGNSAVEPPMPTFTIIPPVTPYRGTRGVDAYGGGGYNAPRDGGSRPHLGLDFVARPDDKVVAPVGGVISHIGIAYEGSTLGSVHLTCNDGQHCIKLLYVASGRKVGDVVRRGDLVGSAQNVAAYWELKSPRGGSMQNHVHLELSTGGFIGRGGMPLDPSLHLEIV